MRRFGWILAGLATIGCTRQRMRQSDQSEPPDAGFASIIHTVDPRAARQLVAGFYPAEPGWRWTQSKFSVVLQVPHLTDPVLMARLFIPETEIARLRSMTMTASVNGVALAPETFTTAGPQSYVRRVPGAVLAADRVRVDFALDKWLPAASVADRELGIVATVVGLKNGLSPEIW